MPTKVTKRDENATMVKYLGKRDDTMVVMDARVQIQAAWPSLYIIFSHRVS